MIEKILAKIEKKTDRDLIANAFEVAKNAHTGQFRAGGEPYITHPVAVAEIIANLKLDSAAIAACLLHDVVEDTPITVEDLQKQFGPEVAFLVNGVTKLSALQYHGPSDTRSERGREDLQRAPASSSFGVNAKQNLKAQSLRKMFFAMAEDIRVILIKLADRYHNLTTLAEKDSADRKRISLETLEIYAPIAGRLGMGQIKGELEDISFKHAYPEEYRWLIGKVKDRYADRHRYLKKFLPTAVQKLKEGGITVVDAHARAKHYYSLYKKFLRYDNNFDRIHDLVALRIIVPNITACYETLGVIHKNFKPLPGLIKDYIALPKLNGYRSIHTTIFGDQGRMVEIQIRTPEMHEHAENGIAAHWSYGEADKRNHVANLREAQWVAELKNWMKQNGSDQFYQSVHTNFFSDRVFVFTPQGDVKDLPEGATPLDFAYAVHTNLGHRTKGAKVNGRLVPLNYRLKSSEVVEIVKGKKEQPSLDWLTIVKTPEARKKIQNWLKENRPAESLPLPIPAVLIAPTRLPKIKSEEGIQQKVFVSDQPDILSSTAKCCLALPGQQVIGYLTKNRGVSVHRLHCPNLKKFNPQRLIAVSWPEKLNYLSLRLNLVVRDKIGMLEEIGRIMRGLKVNILEIKNTPPVAGVSEISLVVALKNETAIPRLLQKLSDHKNILSAKRLV